MITGDLKGLSKHLDTDEKRQVAYYGLDPIRSHFSSRKAWFDAFRRKNANEKRISEEQDQYRLERLSDMVIGSIEWANEILRMESTRMTRFRSGLAEELNESVSGQEAPSIEVDQVWENLVEKARETQIYYARMLIRDRAEQLLKGEEISSYNYSGSGFKVDGYEIIFEKTDLPEQLIEKLIRKKLKNTLTKNVQNAREFSYKGIWTENDHYLHTPMCDVVDAAEEMSKYKITSEEIGLLPGETDGYEEKYRLESAKAHFFRDIAPDPRCRDEWDYWTQISSNDVKDHVVKVLAYFFAKGYSFNDLGISTEEFAQMVKKVFSLMGNRKLRKTKKKPRGLKHLFRKDRDLKVQMDKLITEAKKIAKSSSCADHQVQY